MSSSSPMSASERLCSLRSLMTSANIDCLIVPTADCHDSEYPAEHHMRRQYITGFSGSSGTAVVTHAEALLWTDGRYFTQAVDELDRACWQLMKDGLPSTPSISKWIHQHNDIIKRVGGDSFTISVALYRALTLNVAETPLEFVDTTGNMVDKVWELEKCPSAMQPPLPDRPITVHPMRFAGKSVLDKLNDLRCTLTSNGSAGKDCVVLTDTADSAWLFNLRGSDFDFNPMFLSFSVITTTTATLFCYVDKLTVEAKSHLDVNGVEIRHYDDILSYLKTTSGSVSRFWMNTSVCVGLYNSIPEPDTRVNLRISPVAISKAQKNEAEIRGAVEAHLEDAKALTSFLCWIEELAKSDAILKETELTVSNKLDSLRFAQPSNCGLSFPAISSIGANAAVIHYRPTESKCKPMTHGVYLIDSGGQYNGGTTDVTRTIHLGSPSAFEKECWTRVLKGHIQLASAIFPSGTKGPQLDVLARRFLWAAALNFRHGTGHGVGSKLSVHEGPCGISPSLRGAAAETSLAEGMILSNEPGFYLPDHFGIRHENLVRVVGIVPHTDVPPTDPSIAEAVAASGTPFFAFENLTIVPFQKKFMDMTMLTQMEIEWIDKYHHKIWKLLSFSFNAETDATVLAWLRDATSPIDDVTT